MDQQNEVLVREERKFFEHLMVTSDSICIDKHPIQNLDDFFLPSYCLEF